MKIAPEDFNAFCQDIEPVLVLPDREPIMGNWRSDTSVEFVWPYGIYEIREASVWLWVKPDAPIEIRPQGMPFAMDHGSILNILDIRMEIS